MVNVRSATDDHDIGMISTTGFASRFKCSAIRASGRVSGGVYGIKVGDRKGSGGGVVAGMVSINNSETQILTLSKFGMGKRSTIGTGERVAILDEDGNQKMTESGEPRYTTDGYRQTRPGAKGVRTMKLDEEFDDMIISVRKIPNPDDHLFLLTKKGMMIRTEVSQTKRTTGKATRGTRVMELRNKAKDGYDDEVIFSARLPAELIETTKEDAEEEFDIIDQNQDGVIDKEEYIAAVEAGLLKEEE